MSKRRSCIKIEPGTKRTCTNIHAISAVIANELSQVPEDHEIAPDAVELMLDPLIDRISMSKHLQKTRPSDAPNIPIVTRKYEEEFMRSPHPDEKSCVAGSSCECMMLDLSRPFVGVQFQLPDMSSNREGYCIFCLRKLTHLLYHKMLQRGLQSNVIIQKYGNICGENGEYHPSAMLICPPGGPVHSMPLPIVAHQRTRYIVSGSDKVGYQVRQQNVYMEDF